MQVGSANWIKVVTFMCARSPAHHVSAWAEHIANAWQKHIMGKLQTAINLIQMWNSLSRAHVKIVSRSAPKLIPQTLYTFFFKQADTLSKKNCPEKPHRRMQAGSPYLIKSGKGRHVCVHVALPSRIAWAGNIANAWLPCTNIRSAVALILIKNSFRSNL
jgi:hypothetical protein